MYHSGSHACGYIPAWKRFHSYFGVVVDEFVTESELGYVGEDQTISQGTCLKHALDDLCAYIGTIPGLRGASNRYFGLKHVIHFGGVYQLKRPAAPAPPHDLSTTTTTTTTT